MILPLCLRMVQAAGGLVRRSAPWKPEQRKPFSAIVMKGLFIRSSSNNYGYLAEILKMERVLVLLGKPVMLSLGAREVVPLDYFRGIFHFTLDSF